ncbi:hypothetical protein H3996_03940 [Staphylococcus epidermidis]|uniref:hypothetical protein n=1 Tax=Staphylococcus epidermidis TaxID=1282 RepID=UPI0001A9617C|nr:hypothetical protein CFE88_11030 [Staphylococcus epidermidis]EES35242.1 hypothetical protein HMPREF0791_2104 [Staphylococcus epidermidis W23144]EJD87509.1 hypothetical protein HMPREF9990_10630 [Staphylococcus epidermidis NIHLM061]EJE06515.1 hypothetical protein HMPREF9983_02514 [Staphylococcus epidermidis NIHLM023]KSZ62242.1 hypothetical protein RES1_05465 [Staphylococcus epidermidis]
MELDVLIMPHIAKMEFSIYPDYWKDEMNRIKAFFISLEVSFVVLSIKNMMKLKALNYYKFQ